MQISWYRFVWTIHRGMWQKVNNQCVEHWEWFVPAPIAAWWRSCTISYSFGTFAEILSRLPNLSGFKMADRYMLWPVPNLKIELSRRNASTQGRKTDLVDKYQHYSIAFFVRKLYYSFFSMNKCDHKLHNNKHSTSWTLTQYSAFIYFRGSSSLGVSYFFTRANSS